MAFQGTLANAPQPLSDGRHLELDRHRGLRRHRGDDGRHRADGRRRHDGITFSPALSAGTYAASAAITFKSQQIYVKIGEGNLTYTEHRDYQYLLDRGLLDTVREPKDVPMDVKLGRRVRAHHQRHQRGRLSDGRAEGARTAPWSGSVRLPTSASRTASTCWWSTIPPCADVNRETTVFPMFRAETREMNYSAATIVLTGKCMAKEPTVYRGSDCDNV